MDEFYVDNPVQISVLDPEDQYGTPLVAADATAAITIYTEDLSTVVVASTAMAWNAQAGTWIYQWDPTGLALGGYRARLILTPTIGPNRTTWISLELNNRPRLPAPGQPSGVASASRHFLEPWCSEADIPDNRLVDSNGEKIADIQLGWMIAAATDLLYVLSGRKYRSGRSVVRPSTLVRSLAATPMLYPYNALAGYGAGWGFEPGWAWPAVGAGWAWGDSSSEVLLQGPVRQINSVVVDGVALGANEYEIRDRRRLIRLGGAAWPTGQSMTQDPSQAGTFEVDYEWGPKTKASGRLACAELSTELALSFSGQDNCRLPTRVQSIATQGVTVSVGDAETYLRESLTGLTIVDMFLVAENPKKRRQRSAFLSPETVLNRSR